MVWIVLESRGLGFSEQWSRTPLRLSRPGESGVQRVSQWRVPGRWGRVVVVVVVVVSARGDGWLTRRGSALFARAAKALR